MAYGNVSGYYDTAARFQTNNPLLGAGEVGMESDTGKLKIGDGVASWNTLAYAAFPPKIEARTSDPVSPFVGQIWLRTDL